MPYSEATRREIAEDVASLSRVRNRLLKSSEHQLRNVVPALVPKLFKRLEKYRAFIMNENEDGSKYTYLDSSALSDLEEAKKKINSIIANAMEWLRGSEIIPAESLMRAILPFLNSKNPVVGTWALAFLQVSLQKISEAEYSLNSTIIFHLIESLGQLHHRLQQCQESAIVDTALEAQWIGVSWLLLDSLILHSGKKPLMDWDMEWDRDFSATASMGCGGKNENRVSSLMTRQTRKESNNNSWAIQGMLSLVLDLLLYRPLSRLPDNEHLMLSPLAVRRMEHRIKGNNTDNTDDEEQIFHNLQPRLQQARLRTRSRKWSDSNLAYLHHMQLACFEFAISLLRQIPLQELNYYEMVLCILFASHESMHGRIALSYLKQLTAKNHLVALPVVAHVLILIVGEAQAELLVDSFEKQYETKFWEQLNGSKSSNHQIRRPAIDWKVSIRAAEFLTENPLEWESSITTNDITHFTKYGNSNDEAFATLFTEISLKLSEVNDDEHKYMAMRLVKKFYCKVQQPQVDMVCKIFDLVINILSILANSAIGEELRTTPRNPDERAAGLVPVPFRGRNDLNKLLQTHRQSLKRRNLDRGNAIQAREDAYTMIPLLSAYLFEHSDAPKFRLPIVLLQCTVFESKCLEQYLTEALDSTLAEYKIKFDKDKSLATKTFGSHEISPQQQATFILPALLEAVCSGAEYVRINAIQWIEKLLIFMDAEAASYLASHLIYDESYNISQMAKSILETTKMKSPPIVARNSIPVSFLDLNENNGMTEVRIDLTKRNEELAKRLQISSHEESMALLFQFKFSVESAEREYRKNPQACHELCGLTFSEKTTMDEEKLHSAECGICYDQMEPENSYSLRCGHTFCKSCWLLYMTDASKETSSMNFLDLRCPHHGCSARIMLHDLQRLEPHLISKWNDAILRKFVEEDSSYRYCSGPDCKCVAVVSKRLSDMTHHSLKVTCTTCATSFCFGCGESAHAPATCQDIAQFNLLNRSSQLWVKHHSKPCPGCNVPIEKNQGCNHMQCSRCKTNFCWLCLKILNSHLEPHTCNRYDSTDSAEDDFERQALFTFTRYEAHDTAISFTLEQYKNFDPEKLLSTFWFLDEDEDAEIMENALKKLLESREFLKNSYIAMLGLRKNKIHLKLHEDHHGCLEMFTERLSQLTETNLHRLYTLQGHGGVRLHFRKLAFYTVSVTKYMERMEKDELLK